MPIILMACNLDRESAPLDHGPEFGASDAMNRYWI
jgi:hypothetical protein